MEYINNRKELTNVLNNPANVKKVKEFITAYKYYYQAEENIDKFLYNRKFWMVESGWTLEKCVEIRDRMVSKCIGVIFNMNEGSNGFLRKVRKSEFIPVLNEIYSFIVNDFKHSQSLVVQ